MHFLIIGNGFDIAHDFPTKYTDFLSFCRDYDENGPVSENEDLNNEFDCFLKRNVWLKYFSKLNRSFSVGKTWIDFEKEVSEVIQAIENNFSEIYISRRFSGPNAFTFELHGKRVPDKLERFVSCLGKYDSDSKKYNLSAENVTDLDSFLNYLYNQLREFTRAFEIYCLKINDIQLSEPITSFELSKEINTLELEREKYSHQARRTVGYMNTKTEELERTISAIDKIINSLLSKISAVDFLSMSKFDCVLSFNYTNTYERLYGNSKTRYCYIHGKAQENKDRTNLILGIDDNLSNGEESKNFHCVRFKKYYQRIILRTGSEYMDWLHTDFKELSSENYVHIVGHSLDRTDHDVLYKFFSDKRFRIIVYYHNSKDFEEKVQKVIQLLACKDGNGRDELISRVHGKHWSIKFTYLYDEKEGLFKEPVKNGAEVKGTES